LQARAILVARAATHPSRRRFRFRWRNWFRGAPKRASQPGCPLEVLDPRFYSYASLGTRITTFLQFNFRNASGKTIHSYSWRHASPVPKANGGAGCEPERGLLPGEWQRESAHMTWRGPITITVDFLQFADGTTWLSSDPASGVTRAGLDAGARAAAQYLVDVWRLGGQTALQAALPRLHADVNDNWESRERHGTCGFYVGVTHTGVRVQAAGPDTIEQTLREIVAKGSC
jgi:hypothetical protein